MDKQPEIEFEHDVFDCETIEDEVRVDEICQSLLKYFYQHLMARGVVPRHASDLAYSADYYLRDYLLDFMRLNALHPQPGCVRKFAATWYMTRTFEPAQEILEQHLEGVRELYRFLCGRHLISREELAFIEDECGELEYYRQRLEKFLAIDGDGYAEWERECPLQD